MTNRDIVNNKACELIIEHGVPLAAASLEKSIVALLDHIEIQHGRRALNVALKSIGFIQ